MTTSIFISHNSADKPFARKLASDFDTQGIRYWLDEAEIKVGESLIEKIREGIDGVEYVAVILSPDSINSAWVKKEIDVAMNQEISGKKLKILPLMYRKCQEPGFLLGKKYIDFTNESEYSLKFESLIREIGIVYRNLSALGSNPATHIGKAIDLAWEAGFPIFSHPFHRPFQYMGMTISDAAKFVGHPPNSVGNIIIDTEDCHMCLEAEGNFVNYIDVELKRTAPHYMDKEFNSETILGALSINPGELELIRKKTHYHHYSDHRRRLKISVSCLYDGAPLSVGFSSKYYGM